MRGACLVRQPYLKRFSNQTAPTSLRIRLRSHLGVSSSCAPMGFFELKLTPRRLRRLHLRSHRLAVIAACHC